MEGWTSPKCGPCHAFHHISSFSESKELGWFSGRFGGRLGVFWEPGAPFWTPLGTMGAHMDRKTDLRKMIGKRVTQVIPSNPRVTPGRGSGGPKN